MAAGRFQQVQCAAGVDVEVFERDLACPVVRWLRGAVQDEVELVMPEELEDRMNLRVTPISRRRFQEVSPSGPKKTARMLLSIPCTSAPARS